MTFRTLAFCCLALKSVPSFAKPVGSHTTSDRERARCESGVDLCDSVARDDLNRCNAAGQSHCSDNYYEDINQCTADYNDCLDDIAIKGSAGSVFTLPNGELQMLQSE